MAVSSPRTAVRSASGKLANPSALDSLLAEDPVTVARELLGASLEVKGCGGIIVETEAYTHEDPASHSFRGLTARNRSMFGPAGIAYVYRIYGAHWCLNVVCGSPQAGGAVLIRALQPISGIPQMRLRRCTDDLLRLCSGPGKLAAALGVDGTFDGLPFARFPFNLTLRQTSVPEVSIGFRVGISLGKEMPWRFGVLGSQYLSRKFS